MARILIAEDEPRISALINKGLSANGFTVTVVADGSSAYDYAATGGFDLMILDIGLPDMDGFAVLRRLRAERNPIPVIILTARDSVQDTVSGLEGGADDYMPKPFRFPELLARVRRRLTTERPAELNVLSYGGLQLDLRTRRATVGENGSPVRARVRARRNVPASPRPGAVPRAAAEPRVGIRLRSRVERGRRLRALPAAQAGRRPVHDPARHGLPARRSDLNRVTGRQPRGVARPSVSRGTQPPQPGAGLGLGRAPARIRAAPRNPSSADAHRRLGGDVGLDHREPKSQQMEAAEDDGDGDDLPFAGRLMSSAS